jgi:hypothetical protein
LLTFFGVLTFGIDQVMVKKIADGYNRNSVFSAYHFHVIITGSLFYTFLLLFYLFLQIIYLNSHFSFTGFGKLCIFISTPFKQLAAGLEKFRELFLMSIISKIVRGLLVIILLVLHNMTVTKVLIIFILGDLT